MPALRPTGFTARIIWLGRVPDRRASLRAEPLDRVEVTFEGIAGDAHGGLTRLSCSRVRAQHTPETVIRNVRQLSIVSEEELVEIACRMGVARVSPALLGASMVIEGIPDFTRAPPSSRLQVEGMGTTLVIDMENRPCHLPAREIEAEIPGASASFGSAARGRRGVTAWVEREGALCVGDVLRLHVPDQPAWPHLSAARRGRATDPG